MYKVGDTIEITNQFGSRKYLVIASMKNGCAMLKKCMLEKTKISFVRFPETITLKVSANAKFK